MFHRRIFVILYGENVLPAFQNAFSFRGASPPDPLTRGFAPGPHWGHSPQTPVIGSRSRARHERQRSGSFFVRTGSLIQGHLFRCHWVPLREYIAWYNNCGLRCDDSEDIAGEISENRHFRRPHSHLKPARQRTPANIRVNFISLETAIPGATFLSLIIWVYLHFNSITLVLVHERPSFRSSYRSRSRK